MRAVAQKVEQAALPYGRKRGYERKARRTDGRAARAVNKFRSVSRSDGGGARAGGARGRTNVGQADHAHLQVVLHAPEARQLLGAIDLGRHGEWGSEGDARAQAQAQTSGCGVTKRYSGGGGGEARGRLKAAGIRVALLRHLPHTMLRVSPESDKECSARQQHLLDLEYVPHTKCCACCPMNIRLRSSCVISMTADCHKHAEPSQSPDFTFVMYCGSPSPGPTRKKSTVL